MRDRRGEEITTEHGASFLEIEQPGLTPGRINKFQGLAKGFVTDAKGTILLVAVWARGDFTGREAAVRIEHCLVIQGPKKLRLAQAEQARIAHARVLKAEADAHAKRMIELQKSRS